MATSVSLIMNIKFIFRTDLFADFLKHAEEFGVAWKYSLVIDTLLETWPGYIST